MTTDEGMRRVGPAFIDDAITATVGKAWRLYADGTMTIDGEPMTTDDTQYLCGACGRSWTADQTGHFHRRDSTRIAELEAALIEVVESLVPRYNPDHPEDHGFSPATAAIIRDALDGKPVDLADIYNKVIDFWIEEVHRLEKENEQLVAAAGEVCEMLEARIPRVGEPDDLGFDDEHNAIATLRAAINGER